MNGYVARKGSRWYAVIYEALDPVTPTGRAHHAHCIR